MLRLGVLRTHKLLLSRAHRIRRFGAEPGTPTQARARRRERGVLASSLWIAWLSVTAGCGGKADDGGISATGGSSGPWGAGGTMGASNGAPFVVTDTGGNVSARTFSFVGGTSSVGGAVGSGGMWGCYPALVNSAFDAGPNCGNGILDSANGEGCDDGNHMNGDGCSANCQVEPSWVCPTACAACVLVTVCGNGKVEPGEVCDDGNTISGDGCDGNCTKVEPGWVCQVPGRHCESLADCGVSCGDSGVCGDGLVEAPETCDDGVNDGSYGGCTPGCERAPYCGDGVLNGIEQCDFGSANSPPNNAAYGNCMTNCQMGPHCGDGIVQVPTEECDMGPDNGGGAPMCSATCRAIYRLP
jgi:cysteine-rich repeat protein